MLDGLNIFYANIAKGSYLKHKTLPKVKELGPDVVAFVEVLEDHLGYIKGELGMSCEYFTAAKGAKEAFLGVPHNSKFGSAIFYKNSLEYVDGGLELYQCGAKTSRVQTDEEGIPIFTGSINSMNRAVQWAKVKKRDLTYNILLTHFIWSSDASVTEFQKEYLPKMLHAINKIKAVEDGFVFVGDLNTPRVVSTAEKPHSPNAKAPLTGKLWEHLASLYKENIPLDISSTIDPNLHRISELRLCVDCCFTHGNHEVSGSGVKVIDGVSDHKGLFFEVISSSSLR